MKNQNNKQKGFTLVELMVVLVIIGILATMAIPKFLGASNKAKATEFKPQLKQIYTLQSAYFMEKDTYTASLSNLGFDTPPASTARFTYTASAVATKLGTATPTTAGAKGMGIATSDIGCVDSIGVIKAKASLAAIANVDTGC